MKRILITFITAFSMCCLVACGSETTDDIATGNNNEVVTNNNDDNPATTVEATAEPTEEPSSEVADVEPTEEPVTKATPEPTEEPYFEINNSELIGVEWIESFTGIIDEAKVVVYSLETSRKEIIEKDAVVKINPEKDVLAVYLPEGYKFANRRMGIFSSEGEVYDHSEVFYFDVKTTWEKGPQMAAIYVEHNGEEIALSFVLVPEE